MISRFLLLLACFLIVLPAQAQEGTAPSLKSIVSQNAPDIIKGSVRTAPPIIDALVALDDPSSLQFLSLWQEKDLWYRKSDEEIFVAKKREDRTYELFDIATLEPVETLPKKQIKQIKPNSGLRALIDEALVISRLKSADMSVRQEAISSLSRLANKQHLLPLRGAISTEPNQALKAEMERLERFLTIQFGASSEERVNAIHRASDDLSVETRANLNRVTSSTMALKDMLDDDANIARHVIPGEADFSVEDAYQLLIDNDLAEAIPTASERTQFLIENIGEGKVGRFTLHNLDTQKNRDAAYLSLVAEGKAPFWSPGLSADILVEQFEFVEVYDERDAQVTQAAEVALEKIETSVALSEFVDVLLDAISLASIYFLAAIGLAITFGVMRVINMAHGEFIMMGAYTGFAVQQFVTNYTLSIIIAIPLAFAVTFFAGVALERLVIRHLYHRPLETLLATFGISIALQQLAKNIFGTQARPLTAPEWLDGALVINDVISISLIRIAIFGLGVLFFVVLLFVLNKTRFGLETRAVTQNRQMAASMGINPNFINMLTFGLGSGIAGIAGVAIGLYAKVTSEMGGDYIVQSFMTVVVGGVGNIWGTLAGAVMIGFLQKGIEWFNPANTLAAQTYMIIFIIIFIQFRPRGIIALKGRAAGD
ncbi:putative branched-chain amino acid transport permease protein LivH [Maritalea myrionectae]|uniref:Putative branched-chain amino acid transport permease protein LivH n=1 Tax=Maritalea myrionectae TaxID=454601 RepID=A0A2R4MIL8_9HYPH|nr:urea ABC transporter permease subunit UrtB [Maritalea myrionectae]AVX05779.1 putative branched-chain amino acid transport permease protein LivH [Maritalea myrionectae]